MTPEEVRADARRIVAKTIKAQGLPRTVRDPRVLESVAAVVRAQARRGAS
jgi:hypothetical protein